MPSLTQAEIEEAFLAACHSELAALKPGNVHVHSGGHGMDLAQFQAAADAAAPFIADPRLRVGERIRRAVEASFTAAGCNANLGIVLLCAPLAAAAGLPGDGALRERLHKVLNDLDETDAASAFAAIRIANPGGLGTAAEQDVAHAPSVGLREAMGLAAGRDRIAAAYVTDFVEVFEFGMPVMSIATAGAEERTLAVTTLHMAFLAYFADSHIARKHGPNAAETVRAEAAALAPLWQPVAQRSMVSNLLDFDAHLKARGLNPGTTADLVVATLFAISLSDLLGRPGVP